MRRLSPDEEDLWAILDDDSGIELGEFLLVDEESPDRCWRARDYQYAWFRSDNRYQIEKSGRDLGKSLSIILRCLAWPFNFPGRDMLFTAPELNHLRPVCDAVERHFLEGSRLLRSQLWTDGRRGNGINRQPSFSITFANGARIISRLPGKTGRGVKGQHATRIELDECVPAGTMILTERGQVPIEEVTADDRVWTHRGRWQRVTQTFDRGVRDAIELRGQGHPGFVCTPDHKFYVLPVAAWKDATRKWGPIYADSPEWAQAQRLVEESSRWGAPLGISQVAPMEIPRPATGGNDSIPITDTLIEIMGWYLSEGSTQPSGKVNFSVHPDEVDHLIGLLSDVGLNCWPSKVQSTSNCINVITAHIEFAKFLVEHFGEGAHGKKIPPWIYSLPVRQREKFLEAVIAGDGFYDKDGRYSPGRWKITTVSKANAVGLRLLALSLGMSCNIHLSEPKGSSSIRGRTIARTPFYQVIGSPVKGQSLFSDDVVWSAVRKVKDVSPRQMFDLEVEEDHSFVADGFIIHNSQDYPAAGFVEIIESMKTASQGSQWRIHGVSRGVRDMHYKLTENVDPSLPFQVHRFQAMYRESWGDEERQAKITLYGGSEESIDYRRNVFGEHGDAMNVLLVVARLMACRVPSDPIRLKRSGELLNVTLNDVEIGDEVFNARGLGRVEDVIESFHSSLVEIHVSGTVSHVSQDHPVFTTRGWVFAKDLESGDRLVTREGLSHLRAAAEQTESAEVLFKDLRQFQAENGNVNEGASGDGDAASLVRDLRRATDGSEAAPVLQQEMLGGLHRGAAQNVSHLSESVSDESTKDVLLQGVRPHGQAGEEPTASALLRLLRQGDSPGQGFVPLLQPGVLESIEGAPTCCSDVRQLWCPVHGEGWPEILFALLLWQNSDSTDCRVHKRDRPQEGLPGVLRGVLPPGQEGQVLLSEMRRSGDSEEAGNSSGAMSSLRGDLQAGADHPRVLQQGVLVRGEEGDQVAQAPITHEQSGARWATEGAVPALAGPGRTGVGLEAAVLDVSDGRGGGNQLPLPGHCSRGTEDLRGGRRGGSCPTSGEGRTQGCLAGFPRVESVQVLESGSEGFDRLAGDDGQVRLLDIAVAGHPSYFAGEVEVLNHNCVRIRQDAWSIRYNADVYRKIQITDERLRDGKHTLDGFFYDIPANQLDDEYVSYHAGMDVGYAKDPTEILVCGLTRDNVLRLLLRVQLNRIKALDQAAVVGHIFQIYGHRLQTFAMDKHGNGLPLWQVLTDDADERSLTYDVRNKIKGYSGQSKVPVAFEDRDMVDSEEMKDLAITQDVTSWGFGELRRIVDNQLLELPYDQELLAEFQGQTVQTTKDPGTGAITRRGGSKFSLHTLDAMILLLAGKELGPLEDMLQGPPQTPVFTRFGG